MMKLHGRDFWELILGGLSQPAGWSGAGLTPAPAEQCVAWGKIKILAHAHPSLGSSSSSQFTTSHHNVRTTPRALHFPLIGTDKFCTGIVFVA